MRTIPDCERQFKTCPVCHTSFTDTPSDLAKRRFCSNTCKHADSKNKPRQMHCSFTCLKCAAIFTTIRSRDYCFSCVPFKHVLKKCCACQQEFTTQQSSGAKTCSKACSRRWKADRQTGEKSHLWQGGKTQETKRFRNSLDYTLWRDAVYYRDNYTCRMCAKRGGVLSAHHIKTVSEHRNLALNVENGITLCWPCHTTIKGKEQDYETRFYTLTGGM